MMRLLFAAAVIVGGIAPVSTRAAQAETCVHVPGVDVVLSSLGSRPIRFLVVGERHGTVQTPRLFGDLVCDVARTGPVNVFLELQSSSTAALQTYVSSNGSPEARRAFLGEQIWDPRFADGRNSQAMFDLVDALRRMKARGLDLAVYATQPDDLTLEPQFYDELARADLWAKLAAARPKALNMIFVGTAHAALKDNDDLGFLPAAAHLRPQDVLAVGPADEGGAAWELDVSPSGKPLMGPKSLPDGSKRQSGIEMLRDASSGWQAIYAFGGPAQPSPPSRR